MHAVAEFLADAVCPAQLDAFVHDVGLGRAAVGDHQHAGAGADDGGTEAAGEQRQGGGKDEQVAAGTIQVHGVSPNSRVSMPSHRQWMASR